MAHLYVKIQGKGKKERFDMSKLINGSGNDHEVKEQSLNTYRVYTSLRYSQISLMKNSEQKLH